ncbi:MAG: hypothetical protein KY475_19110 [Planctomycetes bacterium]|nr:hypothetical protein [Planctomycetota bacterium]
MHDNLLAQARRLARLDPSRPKQANLRRAVSSAYYAVFHFLADQACRAAIGAHHDQGPYRQVLARAFAHNVMKAACVSFAGGTLKASVAKGLPSGFVVSTEIRHIARTFVNLQEQRHLADYDLSERFRRSDVLLLVDQAENAVRQFKALPASNEKKFFLACLWAWSNLANR